MAKAGLGTIELNERMLLKLEGVSTGINQSSPVLHLLTDESRTYSQRNTHLNIPYERTNQHYHSSTRC